MIGQPFTDWVRAQIEERNTGLADRNDLNVEVDPEIMQVILNSTAVSTQKGNSAALLKVGSKRRRTRAELEELKEEEVNRQAEAESSRAVIAELQAQLRQSKRKSDRQDHHSKAIQQMLAAGFIVQNPDGGYGPGPSQQQQQ